MLKKLLYLPLLLLFAVSTRAQCNGSSPNWTALSPAETDILHCLPSTSFIGATLGSNTSFVSGDTVHVPAGTAIWSSTLTINTSSGGNSTGVAVNLIGATTCTGTGDPNVGSGTITCTDNTTINLSTVQDVFTIHPSAANFVRISGFNFVNSSGNFPGGVITFQSGPVEVAFRFDHNHCQSNTGGAFLKVSSAYGVIDHNFFQETGTSGMHPAMVLQGDGTTLGYANWNKANQLGTNQAIYVEQNNFTAQGETTTEGMYDGFTGARLVVRFNTIKETYHTGGHGLDSGPLRSVMLTELYGNLFTNNNQANTPFFGSRGGMQFMWGNSFTGTVQFNQAQLQYFRIDEQTNGQTVGLGSFGWASAGLNWIPMGTVLNDPNSSLQMTLNAPDWQATHSYASLATIAPISGGGVFNYQNEGSTCTSGGSRPAFNTTISATTPADGSCTWTNVGGTRGPSTLTTHGYCAANPDTTASADSTCSALSSGDTANRYLDTNGGVYPFRDQPCVGHNQTSMPCYDWLNSGATLPNLPIVVPESAISSSAAIVNRDVFNYTASFDGSLTCATAPRCGVGSGTLASRPATCTTGVGYWATDQGSWNVSGNGSGNGVLYQCGPTNTWTVYYTPFIYPHSLAGTLAPPTNLHVVPVAQIDFFGDILVFYGF